MKQKLEIKNLFGLQFICFVFLFVFLLFFDFISYKRIGAFGCFDDCSIYIASYFMLKGKTLYSQVFFNHQMLAVYISFFVQKLSHPQTIYQLVLYHRLVAMIFAAIMNFIIVFRFRMSGFGFVLLFEASKYYIFGNRFLPEALIVYPTVYLFGLACESLIAKKMLGYDLILSSVFAWFIIFSREPYIPLGLFLFIFILWKNRTWRFSLFSLLLFLTISITVLLTVPFGDYIFNVFTVNKDSGLAYQDINSLWLLKVVFYPIYILVAGKWNLFRQILISIDIVFLILMTTIYIKTKKIKLIAFIIFVLGLANLRIVTAGTIFYQSFHMLIWYGLFLFSTLLLAQYLYQHTKTKKVALISMLLLVVIVCYEIFSSESYIHEKINRNVEFTTHYGNYFAYGEVIKLLSGKDDTLFLDGRDDLIYWVADLKSTYQYSWYTSIMPAFSLYRTAKQVMFYENSPTFYYGDCVEHLDYARGLPQDKKKMYRQIFFSGKPTCLFVKEDKAVRIPKETMAKLRDRKYSFKTP